jgi:hypothetical protein
MPWGAIAGAVVGGIMSSDAASSAAGAQAQASRDATAAQERMFNRQVELQKPFRDAGLLSNNRLMYLLGLDPGLGGVDSPQELQYGDVRSSLLPQFTVNTSQDSGINVDGGMVVPNSRSFLDENGLEAAIQRRLSENQAAIQSDRQRRAQANTDPEFGSLLRDFRMSDFEADPGYAFRQSEGMRGLENSAAARGGLLSGAAMKAIQRFGQDLASQEYGNAYQRFNANQTNKYNRLAGVINSGQGATNQVSNAAGQFGQQQANNIIGAGNAQAAGAVGSANAWNNAIGTGFNMYQSNQLMNRIQQPGTARAMPSGPTVESYYGY